MPQQLSGEQCKGGDKVGNADNEYDAQNDHGGYKRNLFSQLNSDQFDFCFYYRYNVLIGRRYRFIKDFMDSSVFALFFRSRRNLFLSAVHHKVFNKCLLTLFSKQKSKKGTCAECIE